MALKSSPYKKQPARTARPFRIWDATNKKHVPGRCYVHERKAHDGALLVARWAKIEQTLEVYDVTSGRLIGQYKRLLRGVGFTNVALGWTS